MTGGPTVDSLATGGAVGLGTWTFAGDAIWGATDRDTCAKVVRTALDLGVRFFDTAPNYGSGRSEELLGLVLGSRHDVEVATKVKISGRDAGEIRSAVADSLKRLRRDAIDLIQVHWPGRTPEETIDAMGELERLRTEGMVREIGVCNFGVHDLEDVAPFGIVSNQLPYSLLWRAAEDAELEATRAHGLSLMIYGALQQGLLGGRYATTAAFPQGRKRTRHFTGEHNRRESLEALTNRTLAELRKAAGEWGLPLHTVALSFARRRSAADIILVGARSPDQLRASVNAAHHTLSQDQIAVLVRTTDELRRVLGSGIDMFQTPQRVRTAGPA